MEGRLGFASKESRGSGEEPGLTQPKPAGGSPNYCSAEREILHDAKFCFVFNQVSKDL